MKEIKLKNRNKKSLVMVAALTALLAIGSTMAYFIDRDQVTNTFTVGNIDVALEEPNWHPEEAASITPNKELTKDPMVTNSGANDAYVFMSVTVPRDQVKTASGDGTVAAAKAQDLFTYNTNNGWSLIKTNSAADKTEYVYAYGSASAMTKLAAGANTSALFNSVKFINLVEGQVEGDNLDIDVRAMGIQTSDLGTNNPLDIYNIIVKQV